MNKHATPDLKAAKDRRRRRHRPAPRFRPQACQRRRPSISTTCRSRPARCMAASACRHGRARPRSRAIDLVGGARRARRRRRADGQGHSGRERHLADRPPRRAGARRRQGRSSTASRSSASSPRRASRRAAPPGWPRSSTRNCRVVTDIGGARSGEGQAGHAAADARSAAMPRPRSRRRRAGSRARCAIGGQEHFYLEGQIAWPFPARTTTSPSIPRPSIRAKSSTWWRMCSACRRNAVTVEIRRMGGGFGGKETQGNQFAALAAHRRQEAPAAP